MKKLLFSAAFLLSTVACANEDQDLKSGDVFKDCETCPEMVVIPAGEFIMGARLYDENAIKKWELPQRKIVIGMPFAMGRFEVTRAQYQECFDGGGCAYSPMLMQWERRKGADLTRLPIVHISWEDAQQYVVWLSGKTGQRYTLPTEVEWEYAARGGARSIYWWGDELGIDRARCVGCGSADTFARSYDFPLPVGSYKSNPFGLFDLSGNVAEVLQDCFVKSLSDISLKSDFLAASDCKYRSLRGGAFEGPSSRPARLSARRSVYPYDKRTSFGFRLKRYL